MYVLPSHLVFTKKSISLQTNAVPPRVESYVELLSRTVAKLDANQAYSIHNGVKIISNLTRFAKLAYQPVKNKEESLVKFRQTQAEFLAVLYRIVSKHRIAQMIQGSEKN